MAVVKRASNSFGIPMNIKRSNPIPLDTTSVWYSFDEAQKYARTGPTAYVGQVLTVVDEQDNSSKCYVIQNKAGDLILLAQADKLNIEKLIFGKYTYDGSKEVKVDIYEGQVKE